MIRLTPVLAGIIAPDAISPMTPSRARDERGWSMMMLLDTVNTRAGLGAFA
jgi:hypothetical protein